MWHTSNENVHFFQVPEVQKKTVTEEKIHVAVSKEIEPPPKGIVAF